MHLIAHLHATSFKDWLSARHTFLALPDPGFNSPITSSSHIVCPSKEPLAPLHSRSMVTCVFFYACRVSSSEGQAAGLTTQQHAALLYDQWLLDVPKLMDVCVLYGPTNTALLKQFMQQVCLLSVPLQSMRLLD